MSMNLSQSIPYSESVSTIVEKYKNRISTNNQSSDSILKTQQHPLQQSHFESENSSKESIHLNFSSELPQEHVKSPDSLTSLQIKNLLQLEEQNSRIDLIFTQLQQIREEQQALNQHQSTQQQQITKLNQKPQFSSKPLKIEDQHQTDIKLHLQTFVAQQFESYKNTLKPDLFELHQLAKKSLYDRQTAYNAPIFLEQTVNRLVLIENQIQANSTLQTQEIAFLQNQIDSQSQLLQSMFSQHKEALQIIADLTDEKISRLSRKVAAQRSNTKIVRKILKSKFDFVEKERKIEIEELKKSISSVQNYAERANSNSQTQRQFMDKISAEIAMKSAAEEEFRSGISKAQDEILKQLKKAQDDIQGLFSVRFGKDEQKLYNSQIGVFLSEEVKKVEKVKDSKQDASKQIVKNILKDAKNDKQDVKRDKSCRQKYVKPVELETTSPNISDNDETPEDEFIEDFGVQNKYLKEPFIPYNTDYGIKKSQKLLKHDIYKVNDALSNPMKQVDLKKVIRDMQKLNPLEPEIYSRKASKGKRENIDDILNKIDNMKRKVGQKEIYQMYSDELTD